MTEIEEIAKYDELIEFRVNFGIVWFVFITWLSLINNTTTTELVVSFILFLFVFFMSLANTAMIVYYFKKKNNIITDRFLRMQKAIDEAKNGSNKN